MSENEKLWALNSVFGGDSWVRTAPNSYTCTPMEQYDVVEFFVWGDDDTIRVTFNYGNTELMLSYASKHLGEKPVDDGFTPWSYDVELSKFADEVDGAYADCFGY